jgi:ribonucleoside-diphosphate reductase alpha chain
MSDRRNIPDRRQHTTQKVRLPGQRTVYVTVHDDDQPAEVFLRVKGAGYTSEVIALYDVIARLASMALQFGAPLEKVAEMLHQTKFEPAGPVTGHDRIKNCSSLPDLIGRYLLLEYCGREDVAYVPAQV